MTQNPILVENYRGETLESFHRGVVCIVNEQGKLISSIGNPEQICFPRSTMKLFQHLPLLMHPEVKKYNLTLEDMAIMCGSHNGEQIHREHAHSLLERAKLSEGQLKCGAQMPELQRDKIAMYVRSESPNALYNNCSGKHAGFLLYCQLMGYDIETYLNPDHPLQKEIKQACSEIYEFDISKMQVAKDGCSAPIYSVPLVNQAIGYKNLVAPTKALEKYAGAFHKIVEACTSFPYLVAGDKRYCTALMKLAGDRIVAKTGADGVYCLALRDRKWGIAVKMDDGKMGPQYIVVQNILERLGVLTSDECNQLKEYHSETVLNYAKLETGRVCASEVLKSFKLSE